jgi:hypothetical protein
LMAGLVLATNLDRDRAFSAAAKAARDLGFDVRHLTERQFEAKRGSAAGALLLPPIGPYCSFLVSALDSNGGGTELVFQRNSPWWTGLMRMRSLKESFQKLANATEAAVQAAGGKVLQRRDY